MAQGTYLPSTWLPPSLCLLLLIHIWVITHLSKHYSDNQMLFQSNHGISEKMLNEHLDHWDNVCSVWRKKTFSVPWGLTFPSVSCTITGLSLHHTQPGLQKTKSLEIPASQKNPKAVHTAKAFWKRSSSREQWEDWDVICAAGCNSEIRYSQIGESEETMWSNSTASLAPNVTFKTIQYKGLPQDFQVTVLFSFVSHLSQSDLKTEKRKISWKLSLHRTEMTVRWHTNSTSEMPLPLLQEPRNRFLSLCSAHTLAEDGVEQISELQSCSVLLKQKPGSQLEAMKKNTPPRTQVTKSGSTVH